MQHTSHLAANPRRLNILEAAVKEERWRYCRIDGSVTSAAGEGG